MSQWTFPNKFPLRLSFADMKRPTKRQLKKSMKDVQIALEKFRKALK